MISDLLRARVHRARPAPDRMARLSLPLVAAFTGVLLSGGALAASSRAPAVYDVGDARGWSVPPANSTDTLHKWAMRHRFHVGDVLDFKYSNNDSVLLVRPSDYDGCSAASPVSRLKGGGGGGSGWGVKFRLGHPGIFFFISGVPARCEAGLRLVVLVADARGWFGGGAPAPAPGGMEDDELSSSPSGDRPIPVAFRLSVAAGLGFVSGPFFAGLVLWLCVNCGR